jgi:3-methylfumaryl-CoA hydratase
MVAMAATLDKQDLACETGSVMPPLWHWLYFLDPAPQSKLANDGHAERGDFLPPIALPRRMWAGSRFEFLHCLHAGEAISRQSTIKSIELKDGRSGKLAFVCVRHEISNTRGLAIKEEHDIVFRQHTPVDAPPPTAVAAPSDCDYSRMIDADSVLLFRYSALTFNGHRIHYDRDYATREEGYPGLIVHGPLLATLLVELLGVTHPDRTIKTFQFKSVAPVFDLNSFHVCGVDPDQNGETQLWVKDHEGSLCMKGAALVE